jgi:glycosyltransferase involved in cell wall biosynthesis
MTYSQKISVVVPCVDEKKALISVEKNKNIFKRTPFIYNYIIVVDGYGEYRVSIQNEITLIYLEKNYGSYYARNLGAKKSESDFVLFLDDDVVFSNNFLKEIKPNNLYGFSVIFNRKPKDSFENWYARFAFDTNYFYRAFSFFPTLALCVDREAFFAVGCFDETLKSGGDHDFCSRFVNYYPNNLNYVPKINVNTGLRNKKQIITKYKRLYLGQVLRLLRAKYPISKLLIRILSSTFSLFRYVLIKPQLSHISLYLWFLKVSYILLGLINRKKIGIMLTEINSIEVKRNKNEVH